MAYHLEDPENRIIVSYKGVVYDVKEYFHEHPGGSDLIEELLGKEIDEKFEEAEHTKTARKIFDNFPIVGTLAAREPSTNSESDDGVKGLDGYNLDQNLAKKLNIDYSKGIIWQLLTKDIPLEEYRQFVNEPKNFVGKDSKHVKMFDNWFCEVNSKTPWWMIPLAYIPISCYLIYMSEGPAWWRLLCWGAGVFSWTVIEYFLHRFIFHGEDVFMPYLPQNNFMYVFHFCLHGIHHAFPEDSLRLVFPPFLGHIILYFVFLKPLRSALPADIAFAFMLGIL